MHREDSCPNASARPSEQKSKMGMSELHRQHSYSVSATVSNDNPVWYFKHDGRYYFCWVQGNRSTQYGPYWNEAERDDAIAAVHAKETPGATQTSSSS
jgi:hypothetical protein